MQQPDHGVEMRDRFERWARQRCLDLTRCSQDADEYWSATTHIAWAAWQEATKPLVDPIAHVQTAVDDRAEHRQLVALCVCTDAPNIQALQ